MAEEIKKKIENKSTNPSSTDPQEIKKSLVINSQQNILPESLVADKRKPIVDTSQGADSPKKIPKNQD